MHVTRRQFFRICAAGGGRSGQAALGFAPGEALADVWAFKLARASETRSPRPYCSVSCGLRIYSVSVTGYLSVKLARSPGRLALDTQARI